MQNKKEPSTFLKIQSKHRQVISSEFSKSFRGARDLVLFYVFFTSEIHQGPLNSSETCLKSPDGILIKFSEKSKVPFFERSLVLRPWENHQ